MEHGDPRQRRGRSGMLAALVALLVVIAPLAACGGGGAGAPAQSIAATGTQSAQSALIDAAKREGTVTWYTNLPASVAQSLAGAFDKKYGIKLEFIKLGGSDIFQRYGAEGQAGNIVADIASSAVVDKFVGDGVQKGWIAPLKGAGIPSYDAKPCCNP